MHIKVPSLLLVLAASCLSLSGANASDHSYHNNVSDVEVEDSIKGETYNKGPVSYFGGSEKKGGECSACSACAACSTCAASSEAAPVAATAATSANGRQIKYILDGKPVYEDGAKGETGDAGALGSSGAPQSVAVETKQAISDAEIATAIGNLGNAGWRDAQALLIRAGKTALPQLIDALGKPGVAYNLAGHTKADAGRALRQLTLADVCASLLEEIVLNHSNYQGETPGANQAAWQAWWNKNGQSVTFGS